LILCSIGQSVNVIDNDEPVIREYLKGEVLQYRWLPVWLVWNQLYDNRNFCCCFD